MEELLDHYKPLDEYVGDLVMRQGQLVGPGTINYSIYDKRYAVGAPGFLELPCSIYFYYVRLNGNGTLFVTHHFYRGGDPNDANNPANPADWPSIPRDQATLTSLVQQLAEDARPTGAHTFPVIGQDFKNIEWRRKSYIAIFVDEANWTLHKFSNADPSVVFITEPKNGTAGLENHSFFDAMDLEVDMPINGGPATDKRSAIIFINHMKGDDLGNDIGSGVRQFFRFKMFFDVKFADGTDGMTVIFDPDGTNVGPPLPPP